MRLLCIGLKDEVVEQTRLALEMRWPELRLDKADTGISGVDVARRKSPDMVMIQHTFRDTGLQDVIRSLRRQTDKPIIVWGVEQGEMEAVAALESGADEYIRASCGLMELVARTVALLRRAQLFPSNEAASPASSGTLHLDPRTMEVSLAGSKLDLTPTEFRLLQALMRNRGSVVTRRFLEQNLWDSRSDAASLVKKYVQRLRMKLGDDSAAPSWIANVPGVGYRFVGPSEDGIPGETGAAAPAHAPDGAAP